MTSILIIFALILSFSFVSSLVEAIFLSTSPGFVSLLEKEGKRSGLLLAHLKENINRPISAILTFNTITNTVGSTVVGAKVQELYGDTALSITSAALTFGILIFTEILPKTIGATYWKSLAPFAAYVIQALVILQYPIVKLIEWVTNLLHDPEETTVTREEMIANAEIGVEEGELHKKESAIIKNLLMLNNVYVADIMTPRSVAFALEADMTVEEVANKYKPLRFSRIPVMDDNMDHVIGLTHRYKILEAMSSDHHDRKIREIMTPILTVSEKMSVAAVIDFFVRQKEHLALVIDEYGIVTGLVTLEDAIETLLGVEIVDEFDNITDMRQYALDQWKQRRR